MQKNYVQWLTEHLEGAKARYEELNSQDEQEEAEGVNSGVYEQAHQMFGYVAALEKCLKEATGKELS